MMEQNNDTTTLLESAIALAVRAHAGQRDKYGAPYVLHPLRVMLRCEGELARIVAVLHDVVEDTPITLDELRAQGFPETVIEALDLLTRRAGDSYEAFIERIAPHPLARRVKLADLEDNMDVRRITVWQEDTATRLERYRRAWQRLQEMEP